MADAFDPLRAVRFDPPKGVVVASDDARLVVLSASSLDAVARALSPDALDAFGEAIGTAMGARARERYGSAEAVRGAAVDAVFAQVGGELAVAGFGHLAFERRGRALVLVLERPPLASDRLAAAIVAGALAAASGRDLACEPLGRERGALRLLVARAATALRLRALIASGVPWGEAVVRVQSSAAGES